MSFIIRNSRPISISNPLAQLFERVILNKIKDKLITSPNQFGFKNKSSCNHAIFTIRETILSYIEKGSICYLASLDAEKAFDKVWRPGIFAKLIDRIDDHIWLTLNKYYENSFLQILNGNEYSSIFKSTCGVKQGGILSPFLFNMYIDELIQDCLKMNIGAKIANVNTSTVSYCDDLNLISPTAYHLQRLIDTCQEYGSKWKIKFNPNKSNIVIFGKPIIHVKPFKLGNNVMNTTNRVKILGYVFDNNSIKANLLW